MGSGANIFSGCSDAAPEGMLALAETNKSLSRISGELPTMVKLPPMMMAAETGISRRDRLMPVRAVNRETTGRYSAVAEVFCMMAEFRPATACASNSSRCSMPCARRSNQLAKRLSAPVRSRPAPRIMVAMTFITASEEKPPNRSSGATSPVSPSSTNTTSDTTSARMRSNRNITMVKHTKPSTHCISVVRVRVVSIRPFNVLMSCGAVSQ